MNRLVDWLIALGKRTPYSHLYHGDGSAYMLRFWLIAPSWWTLGWAVRLHFIATADDDRHLHDHPFSFLSIVLRGWYVELRPVERDPRFVKGAEPCYMTQRKPGDIAWRPCFQRHRISHVSQGGVWTLVITTPARQPWGFYTPKGKTYWRAYQSIHEAKS